MCEVENAAGQISSSATLVVNCKYLLTYCISHFSCFRMIDDRTLHYTLNVSTIFFHSTAYHCDKTEKCSSNRRQCSQDGVPRHGLTGARPLLVEGRHSGAYVSRQQLWQIYRRPRRNVDYRQCGKRGSRTLHLHGRVESRFRHHSCTSHRIGTRRFTTANHPTRSGQSNITAKHKSIFAL